MGGRSGFGYYKILGKHGFDATIDGQIAAAVTRASGGWKPAPNQTGVNEFYNYYYDATSGTQCTRLVVVDYNASGAVSSADPLGIKTSYAYVGWYQQDAT